MANSWKWKVTCYHSIDDEEKQVFIDIHEIANDCIKQMKKKYPALKWSLLMIIHWGKDILIKGGYIGKDQCSSKSEHR